MTDIAQLPIDKPSFRIPEQNEIPNEDDMGLNDLNNILYVNMEGPDLGERFRQRMGELEQMLALTHRLATIHAGIQVRRRKEEGQLPTDDSDDSRWRRATYRARVMEVYFNDGVYPWIFRPSSNSVRREIDADRSRFHWELLAAMLAGIVLPLPLAASSEAILGAISQSIQETNFTSERRAFWSLLQVYTYDEVRDDLRASLRNINYSLSKEMHTTIKNKSTESSVKVLFSFEQTDFSFNERTWESMKSEVEQYVGYTRIGNMSNPPSVPV